MADHERPAFRVSIRVGDWALRYRWLVLTALVMVTLVLGTYGSQVTYDFGILKFFPDDSPYHEPYLAAEAIFGRDDSRNLIAFDIDPYSVDGFEHLRELTAAIEAVDGIAEVTSLANVQRLRGDGDNIIIQTVVPDDPTEEDLAHAREVVRADPMLHGLYVAEDEQAAALVVEFGVPRVEAERRQAAGRAIDEVLARMGKDGVAYHQAGIPHTRNLYARLLLEDNRSVIPGIMLMLIVLLAAVYRRPAGVILPIGAVGVALSWTLGVTVLLERPLNMITNTMLPVILVVGIADSIHILNAYRELYRERRDRRLALRDTIGEMGIACLMTSFTTAIGFGVLTLTNVPILREFGLICAVGVLASYVTTVLGLPVALSFLKPLESSTTSGIGGWASRALGSVHAWVVRRRRWILAAGMIACAGSAVLATRVQRSSKVLEDLRPDHPEIQSRTYIEERFGGAMPLNVVIRGDVDDFRTPEALAGLVEVADAMAEEEILGWPVGLHSLVETLHRALAPDHPERVPRSRALLAQELLLYELSGDERLEDVVSEDFSSARVLARSEDALTDQVEATCDRVYAAARAAFPESMRVDVTSTMVLAQAVNRTLIANMSMSFATAFLVIFITMLAMFRSWRLALLAFAPNLAPLFFLVAFMAIAGIGLKVSTAFIFAIAFGIAVDDTIHFLARIKRERAHGRTRDQAIEAAMAGTGRAIVQTTLVLVLGFSILLASEFLATANFGLLTGVTLTVALVADLTLLPALLLTTRRW